MDCSIIGQAFEISTHDEEEVKRKKEEMDFVVVKARELFYSADVACETTGGCRWSNKVTPGIMKVSRWLRGLVTELPADSS